jgi:glutamate synthase domain-containing protein 3
MLSPGSGAPQSRGIYHDLVDLSDLDGDDTEVLQRLVREHEEKTASPRARNILVRWGEFVSAFRKITPRGTAIQTASIREAYLRSPSVDPEISLARRTA